MTRWLLLAAAIASVGCRRHRHDTDSEAIPSSPPPITAPPEAPPALEAPPAPPAGAAAPMPPGGTINGDPRGPRAAEFNKIVQAALPRLQACFDEAKDLPNGQLTVSVHYVVEPPGYTGAVSARGAAPQPVLDCCRRIFENLQFPQFRGPKVEQDYPVTYVKRPGLD
jgi:hypothetical protein